MFSSYDEPASHKEVGVKTDGGAAGCNRSPRTGLNARCVLVSGVKASTEFAIVRRLNAMAFMVTF